MNIGFLASHGGSNMQAIIDAAKSGKLHATPVVVISNNTDSMALARARTENIPAYYLSSKTHPDPDSLDDAILGILMKHNVDIVALAGYMKKLGHRTLDHFKGRILNIHPALLPKHGGKGMYGIHVHESVIAAGDTETGVTVHLVNEEYDRGPILAQVRVAVEPGDTPDTLAARVLIQEHLLYPATLERIATGELKLETIKK
ncbi:MAG: phosphoribosylglycinamide formyltransferase [Syntrophorhabdus sp.]